MNTAAEGSADDLPRALLENYLLLAAAIESQNAGRLSDMLQYSQKVHSNLLEVMQQVEAAPTLAMTAGQAGGPAAGAAAEQAAAEQAAAEGDVCSEGDAQEAATAPAGMARDSGPHPMAASTGVAPQGPAATATTAVRPGAAAGLQQQHQQRLRQYQPHGQQQQRQPPQQQLRQLPGGMSGAPRQAHLQQPQQQQQQQPLPQLDPLQQQQQQHQPLPLPPQAPGWLQQVNVSVSQLLQGLGLGQFVPLLEQQQVDMAALQLLEERHLRELGLPIGAVVKIRAALSARGTGLGAGGGGGG